MAWLHATPKPVQPGQPTPGRTQPVEKRSRLEQLKAQGLAIQMPPNPAPVIVDWLIEIGLKGPDGPLSWLEINQWQVATGISLSATHAKLIRKLSVEYVAQARKAEEENCPAPWAARVTDDERSHSDAKLRAVLG